MKERKIISLKLIMKRQLKKYYKSFRKRTK